jgi:hypothetical protein
MFFWFVQGIGAVGLAFIVYSYASKTRNDILRHQIAGSGIYILHFALLSAWTGALMNVIVIFRNWVFIKKDTRSWAGHPGWILFFILLSIGSLYFSWEGWISLLPVIAVILGIIGRWHDSPAVLRIYGLIGAFLWVPYTIVVHSYSGIVTQIFIIIAIIIGMIRHDRKVEVVTNLDS